MRQLKLIIIHTTSQTERAGPSLNIPEGTQQRKTESYRHVRLDRMKRFTKNHKYLTIPPADLRGMRH